MYIKSNKISSKIKTIYGIALLFATLSFVGCKDDFLEVKPTSQISDEVFVKDKATLQQVVNGAYKAMADGEALGGLTQVFSELMSDNITAKSAANNGDYNAVYNHTSTVFLGTSGNLIKAIGRITGRANYALSKVEEFGGTDKARITGECKFIRAVGTWEITKVYAQPWGFTADNSHLGMPIHKKLGIDAVNRSTVKECYAFIESELREAIDLLPVSNGNYANKLTAKGMLAKVYFQQNRYQDAYNMANDVITSGSYQLDSTVGKRFSDTVSTETVFGLKGTTGNGIDVNGGGKLQGEYKKLPAGGAALASLTLTIEVADAYAPYTSDLRKKNWIEVVGTEVICNKFKNTSNINAPLVHLSELLLIRAECAAELNNLSLAASDINALRLRAKVPVTTEITQTGLIRAAREERRRELIAEGNRLHDLKRIGAASARGTTALPVPNLLIRNAPWNCNGMILQIHNDELSAVKDMQANPEGGCN